MANVLSLMALVFLSFCPLSHAQNLNHKTIYGDDSRTEVSQQQQAQLARWVQRTVAFVDRRDLIEERNGVRGKLRLVGHEYQLCQNERFYSQPSLSFCTGFFLDNEWVATAKHCVEQMTCEKFRMLLDYRIEKNPDFRFTYKEQLTCAEIVESQDLDLAFVRVRFDSDSDRPTDLVRLPVVSESLESASLKGGQRLQILGFPLGLPMKWAEGKLLRKKSGTLYADIDSFEGNSGSPILDSQSRVLGLLLGGEEDFESLAPGSCRQSYRCSSGDQCEGEEILSIQQIMEEFDQVVRDDEQG